MNDKILKCSVCGKAFTKTYKNRKYCSRECSQTARKQKRIKYNKNNYEKRKKNKRPQRPRTNISIQRCKWCKHYFIAEYRTKPPEFCSKQHRKYARMENNLKSVREYQRKYRHDQKSGRLGNSNLHGKRRNKSDEKELKEILAEITRLGLSKMIRR